MHALSGGMFIDLYVGDGDIDRFNIAITPHYHDQYAAIFMFSTITTVVKILTLPSVICTLPTPADFC